MAMLSDGFVLSSLDGDTRARAALGFPASSLDGASVPRATPPPPPPVNGPRFIPFVARFIKNAVSDVFFFFPQEEIIQ